MKADRRVVQSSLEKVIMKKALWMRLAVALAAAVPIAACTASSPTTDSTGEYIDDATITTKVKTALLDDSGLKSFDISVTKAATNSNLIAATTSSLIAARLVSSRRPVLFMS